ncbi:MAG: outer membrane protein [Xanthobacteraceae bacterium]
MHKHLLAGAALLALGLSAPATAADMPLKYVAPAPIFTWTGCYVGAHVGYKWGTSKQTYGGLIAGVPVLPELTGADITGNYNVNGPVGGAQGGCNYQTGAWVWGIEVDGGWSSASGQANAIPPFNPEYVLTTNERWLATARGRLGWAADRWMWYLTGGVAWSGFDVNNSNPLEPAQVSRQPTRINKTGWIVGVGTEYALLGGWSVKSEFLYANFGTMHYGDESSIVNGCLSCFNADVKMSEYIWRVGLNYRFDWASWGKGKAPAPVVAKY